MPALCCVPDYQGEPRKPGLVGLEVPSQGDREAVLTPVRMLTVPETPHSYHFIFQKKMLSLREVGKLAHDHTAEK